MTLKYQVCCALPCGKHKSSYLHYTMMKAGLVNVWSGKSNVVEYEIHAQCSNGTRYKTTSQDTSRQRCDVFVVVFGMMRLSIENEKFNLFNFFRYYRKLAVLPTKA